LGGSLRAASNQGTRQSDGDSVRFRGAVGFSSLDQIGYALHLIAKPQKSLQL